VLIEVDDRGINNRGIDNRGIDNEELGLRIQALQVRAETLVRVVRDLRAGRQWPLRSLDGQQ
jgi:hypothetical protein